MADDRAKHAADDDDDDDEDDRVVGSFAFAQSPPADGGLSAAKADADSERPKSESMSRRALRAVSSKLGLSSKKDKSEGGGDMERRGSSLARLFGGGGALGGIASGLGGVFSGGGLGSSCCCVVG